MNSNQLVDFDYSPDHFNYTKYFTFQIHNSVYDDSGRCKLTVEQRKFFSFVCKVCGSLVEVNDFRKILMERTESWIRQRVNFNVDKIFKETEKRRNRFEFEMNRRALELLWSDDKNLLKISTLILF